MRRTVWLVIGAAGGIVGYRWAQQAMVDVRERGVVLSAQQVGASVATALKSARALAAGTGPTEQSGPPIGRAAASVLAAARRPRPDTQESNRGIRRDP